MMDQWSAKYLKDWQDDFAGEPDLVEDLHIQRNLLEALEGLYPSDSSSQQRAASSIATFVKSKSDPEESLILFQAILLDAATTSPLQPPDLAQVVVSFTSQLPGQASKKFYYEIACSVREKFNGPEKHNNNEKEKTKSIQAWIRLNAFVAYLTQLHACSLESYGLWTFYRVFDEENERLRREELDYHVPAAEAWVQIMGEELYQWTKLDIDRENKKDNQALVDRVRWDRWKHGFADCARLEGLRTETKLAAESAWRCMNNLESNM
ncbi:hypothetical protein L228DRAFT_268941 [Xylona heveae TC161]|uniref:Uncharacterized protein n=1 Tax=Xylona heveae (strain CBS 132557 / TC161) TaxID=1328760 RepID=A0A165FWC9_XYLHT|nr:hypothetical protein L228DRAFT_268941 [Xylona heveae TC161]KZF21460.1 hypothetical protein L228DRAFT_268941 [Xylona heveae TC161]